MSSSSCFNRSSSCSFPFRSLRSTEETETSINLPNPEKFQILRYKTIKPWVVVEVIYPDAKNYEGRKIMLYRATIDKIMSLTYLDPHFCDHKEHLSPFARFEPTPNGWAAALQLARIFL